MWSVCLSVLLLEEWHYCRTHTNVNGRRHITVLDSWYQLCLILVCEKPFLLCSATLPRQCRKHIQLLRSEEQRNKEKTGRERNERREWGGTPSTTTASVIVSLSGRRGLSQSVCLHSRSLKRRQTQEVRKHVRYDCFLLHSTRPPLWSLETEAQLQAEQDSKDLSYTANINSFQCQTGEEWCEMLVHSTAVPAARWAQLSMILVSVIAVLDTLSSTRLS